MRASTRLHSDGAVYDNTGEGGVSARIDIYNRRPASGDYSDNVRNYAKKRILDAASAFYELYISLQ
jgi:hypothetical protein